MSMSPGAASIRRRRTPRRTVIALTLLTACVTGNGASADDPPQADLVPPPADGKPGFYPFGEQPIGPNGLRLVRRFEGHEAMVKDVAVSPDGRLFASASGWPYGDYTARVWDAKTGEQLLSFRHPEIVQTVNFSPDGTELLTGDYRGVVRRWNCADGDGGEERPRSDGRGRLLTTYNSPRGNVLDASFSPDGKQIVATGFSAGGVHVWDRDGDGYRFLKAPNNEQMRRVVVSPDGERAIGMNGAGQAFVWNLADGRLVRSLPDKPAQNPKSGAGMVLTGPDRLLAATGDGKVRLWNFDTGKLLQTIDAQVRVQDLVAIPGQQRAVLVGGLGRKEFPELALIDLDAGKVSAVLKYEGGVVWGAALTPDGKRLLTASGARRKVGTGRYIPTGDDDLGLWRLPLRPGEADDADDETDVASAPPAPAIARPEDGGPAFSLPDDAEDAAPIAGGFKLVRRFEGHTNMVKDVAISSDGKRFAGGSGWPQGDSTARVWEAETGTLQHTFQHPSQVQTVAFSPDGDALLTGSADGGVRLWDCSADAPAESSLPRRQYVGTRSIVLDVDFSPDGRWIVATGYSERGVHVWNRETGDRRFLSVPVPDAPMRRATVSRDGRWVLGQNANGQLFLWDMASDKLERTLPENAESVSGGGAGLALVGDGRALAAAGDGVVRLWELGTGKMLKEVDTEIALQGLVALPGSKRAVAVGGRGRDVTRELATIDLEDGTVSYRLNYSGGFFWAAAATPDGKRLLTASGSRKFPGERPIPTGDNDLSLWTLPPTADAPAADADGF